MVDEQRADSAPELSGGAGGAEEVGAALLFKFRLDGWPLGSYFFGRIDGGVYCRFAVNRYLGVPLRSFRFYAPAGWRKDRSIRVGLLITSVYPRSHIKSVHRISGQSSMVPVLLLPEIRPPRLSPQL